MTLTLIDESFKANYSRVHSIKSFSLALFVPLTFNGKITYLPQQAEAPLYNINIILEPQNIAVGAGHSL